MKAILVIKMPKSCAVCPIFQEGIDGYCPVGFLSPSNKYEIAERCPLKPIPQKKELKMGDSRYTNYYLYRTGWNECLAEITGETE